MSKRFSYTDHAYIKALDAMLLALREKLDEYAPHLTITGDPGCDSKLCSELVKLDDLALAFDHEHRDDMWVVVYEPGGEGTVHLQRLLEANEEMDEEKFAWEIADDYEREIDEQDGYIPNCCGDIRVEFRRDPDNGTVIFSGRSFYFKREE